MFTAGIEYIIFSSSEDGQFHNKISFHAVISNLLHAAFEFFLCKHVAIFVVISSGMGMGAYGQQVGYWTHLPILVEYECV